MAKVRLETWFERVEGEDKMGEVFTFGEARIGHFFKEGKYITVRSEYANLIPQMIRALAIEVGPSVATTALHDTRVVP